MEKDTAAENRALLCGEGGLTESIWVMFDSMQYLSVLYNELKGYQWLKAIKV